MSMYGSNKNLSMGRRAGSRGDLAAGMTQHYARSEVVHGGGNGYDPYMDGYNTYTFSKSSMGGMAGGGTMGGGMSSGMMTSGMSGGMMSSMGGGMAGGMAGGMSSSNLGGIHQRAMFLQGQCQEYLKKAEYALQTGTSADAERYMGMAKETIEQLKGCAVDLRQMGQPNDNVVRTLEMCKDQLKGVHMAITGTMTRRRSTRGSGGGWEEPGRSFQDAMGWIAQQKRLIETASWGDDAATIEQQLISHQKFHSSIQRSPEIDRARDDLMKKGDKGNLHALDQEWDSLQQMSFGRTQQLQDLQQIIQEMSREIMWVNDREEEELMFDWGDKNIDQYIPRKQESYSKLMSALEDKEKDLNKLKTKVDTLLKNNHPASDKIEAYRDTLQTQWSWLLQITKCIDVHLKENAAYSQFFKEANETYSNLQKEHETVRKKFVCDKNTTLEDLLELHRGLEREKEKIMENKRQVQHLVNSSKNIVRLKPRNPEEKSNNPIIVKALCDFKQDQKVILKGNEAILKDNSQRSKWDITGPGGLDMSVPSVCLIVPPPNPISISLANKNEQYYEAILSIWNQLFINVKSLIAWQYCLLDIRRINSLTISMLAKMRPEEYRQIIKSLETHFEEFKVSCHGSQMFADDDKKSIENQFQGAQAHYDQLVVQLPVYIAQQEQIEIQQVAQPQQHHQFIIIQQQQQQQAAAEAAAAAEAEAAARAAAEEEARRLEEERRRAELRRLEEKRKKEQVVKKETVKVVKTEPVKRTIRVSSSSSPSSSSRSLSELHELRLRLESAEGTLSQYVHICVGDDGVHDCGLKITQLETVQRDVDSMREEYLRLRERILRELEGMTDSDKSQFLRSEVGIINQRLGILESSSSAYLQRLRALRDMLESVARAEDIVKVHEARLTEKETTSLSPSEVEEYMLTLKGLKAELDQKRDVLASMEAELSKASHWNGQVGGPSHRCDMMLSKYTEEVGLLSDRWKRINGQIDTRLLDLQAYHPQLQHYKQTSASLFEWIDATRKKQDALRATKIDSIQTLMDHINSQKTMNAEIKSRRGTVESVLRDNEACVNCIKDYETDLNSYTSGLETLLNIPIKRTMLKSPSMDLNQEATELQTRYLELLTMSGDYYKFLGELQKNMEELKIRNTRIDLLEEELRLLRDDVQDRDAKNKSLEESVVRYQLELSQSQNQLLEMEEVKETAAAQCNATRDSLDSSQSELATLSDQVTRLNYLLEEEKRKRRLAEERYTQQQEEYDLVLRKRQKELETVSWSKVEVEKSVVSKDHEIEQLRRQLAEEASKIKELQKEMSKVRSQCNTEINNLKLSYESQIHVSRTDIQRLSVQRDEDTVELQMQYDRMVAQRRSLEEELRRLRMSVSEAEEQRKRAEEEAHSLRAVITEEGRRRRELESEVEDLMRQRDEESSQYAVELAKVTMSLEEKSEELAYITHSLDEETRRRRTIEEGKAVLEHTVERQQVKLTSSTMATTELGECKEELERIRIELERESRERSRVEQNMSRLQGRMKDLQAVRDGLESQVENLRRANQEEVARRRQAEGELEKTTSAVTEYTRTINTLRQSQDQASLSEKRGEEERLRLQEELEISLRQNKTSAERMAQLSAEQKALQQQLLQEQGRVKEANLRNESLYKTIEERSKALNENAAELERMKELTEAQTKERLRLDEELRVARHDKEELLRSKQECDVELSSQITSLQLQLQSSERSNKDYDSLVSERTEEKLRLEEELKVARYEKEELMRVKQESDELSSQIAALQLQLQSSERSNADYRNLVSERTDETLRLEGELRAALDTKEELLRSKQESDELFSQISTLQVQLQASERNNKDYSKLVSEQTELRQKLEEELKGARQDKEELLKSKQECDNMLSSQIAALQVQLQASERSIKDYSNQVSEQTEKMLRLEEELKVACHDKEELLRSKKECDGELSSQIAALQLQLQASEHSNKETSIQISEQTEERLRLEEELKAARHQNIELLRSKEECDGELSSQIAALQLQLQASERSNKETSIRISEQTEERLRLEEELKAARHQNVELLRSKKERDDELSSQMASLQLQLQASEHSNKEYRNLVSELSTEREKLKLETDKIQSQATEATASMQSLQSQYSDILTERDALLRKLQMLEKDKDRVQRLEEELSHIKLSLESELRNKQRLSEDNERVKRDLGYWKDQYESKQGTIRQYDSDKERLEREKTALKSEIERLMRELRDLEESYKNKLVAIQKELREVTVHRQTIETELKRTREPPTLDASTLVFDGVRKPVTADQLLDCHVLDKSTFNQLVKGHKTVPDVSIDKKINLKGTGPIAGVVIDSPKGPGSITGTPSKMTFTEAKKENLLPSDSVDLLLDAQAATGHIIDPRTNQKLTVEEALNQGVVDEEDRERLLAAEAAAIGYRAPGTSKPLSVFQAMKKGMTDKNTTLRLLQAQESVGGILDPVLSVFLPKDTAIERNLIDNDIQRALNQRPEVYLDPDSEEGVTYSSLKRKCRVEPHTGLLLLPITEKVDPSKLVFEGVRKPVTARQLVDCGVLDKPTFKDLERGKKTVPDVSEDKKVNLKGTGPIAGVVAGSRGKMSLSDAKKQKLLPEESADLLLEAQAATGHIIDPKKNQKLTVEEACARDVVDISDRDRLLAAEAAAVGYKDPSAAKPLSVYGAMRKGVIDKPTGLRLLQAQESVGGILDPHLSVFLPKDTAIKRNLLDADVRQALKESPQCYIDPETEDEASYGALKKRCKAEPHTGLLLLPITEKVDPSKLVFDGVRKPVTAQQLVDCSVLDKPTFKDLQKGEKTVPDVSEEKKVNLKGTGPIAGVLAGNQGKMSFAEAKKQMLLPEEIANLLLEAQAATGHIIDPKTNQKLTVEEACARGVVDNRDRDRLLAAEAAAVGYRDPTTAKPLSAFEAMKKGLIDKPTGVRLLQAQESVGGILDPNLSVFLPKDTAIKRKLLDENLRQALKESPKCYLDPETEGDASYGALKKRCKTEPHTGLLLLPITEKLDPSKLIFDGVRKPVTAQQLLDCGVLDKPTFNQLVKGEKTVPEVSVDKKVFLKGTGSIAGVAAGPQGKMSFSEAKKQMLMPQDSADLLLDAQAATGHIIDPTSNQKLTVEEACARRVVDIRDRDRLLAAEAAAVGYRDPTTAKPLSVFEALKKGLIDKKTGLRLLQAQESAGGILDPNLSVFLPKDTAIKRNLLDEELCHALNKMPECYLDPDTERDASYGALKKRCKKESHTGLNLLPITERKDPSKLMFDGVRKPVSAQQLFDCGVLDKPTFNQLVKGEKTVPEVSEEKKVFLKGTGPIAGVEAGRQGKISFSEAKKQRLVSDESADLLLEAQAATGHIIDPKTGQKLTVEEACAKGVVDNRDRDRLLAGEAAAVGYKDPRAAKPLSVFEAMNKGLIDKKTGLRLLQAQESVGGILDPNLSVFLPKDTAIKHNLLDENLRKALKESPKCYLDPETESDTSYGALKKRCKTEPRTGQLLLPVTEKLDPSKLIFDGVRKPVTAQQLLDCGVLDKPTLKQLMKGEKTVPEVSMNKRVYLKGTGSIAGVAAGPQGKMSFAEAKKQMLMPQDSADLLLDAQAATGHIIDPTSNQKLTVEEACAKGVVDIRDRDRLLAAEAAAVGYQDPGIAEPLSVFEAMKKGLIDKKTGLRLLQAQESAGGILDPSLSVFLPKDTAIKRNLLDEDLCRALNKMPECYLDPDTERDASYEALKKRCKTDSHTGLVLLPITERKDPSKLMFDGVRKPVSAQQLLDCGVLDKPTFNQLVKGEKTVPKVSEEKKVYLKGTGPIAGVEAGRQGKISFSEAKKQRLLSEDSADLLLEAQAATGHIIDPKTGQKLTVEEACAKGVVDIKDRDRLLAAEAAAVGYKDPRAAKPLSVFEAMNKGLIDKKTGLRLLQAQESAGGIMDPNLSVLLPKDTAIKRNLLDEDLCRALNKMPECYLDPDTERDTSYGALKKRCKTESHTGLILLPIIERKDPSKLMFDGVRKPVSAQQLLDCGVLDKPTFNQLVKGEKTVPKVSEEKKVYLQGTGPIAGVEAGRQGKMSVSEAKKRRLLSDESADLLLEAQAATGHIIDPKTGQKLTVEEACAKGVVDIKDRDRLLAAEAAAVGYKDPRAAKPLSVFEAMNKGLIDKKTGLRLLQAQESAGGIMDPNLSVLLPKDTAKQRNLLDEDLCRALNKTPECYLDPDTERGASYGALKKRCKTESHTGLILLPIIERKDPSKLMFDGVRKPVSAQQLLDCGVLDEPTFNQLVKGEKTVPKVSEEKKVYLQGTGPIAGVEAGRQGKMSVSEAKKRRLLSDESADLLLEAQAATGHIIDPKTGQKLTVEEACAKGVVDIRDRERLLAAEAAAVGYKDPSTAKPLSVFEAMNKGLIDKKTGLRLLQAQESAGGIMDPTLSVFLPKDTAIKRSLLDENLRHVLDQNPKCFLDPDTENDTSFGTLKKRCKTEPRTGQLLLPINEKLDPSKLIFDGVRKPVTAQQLLDCGILDKFTFNQLIKGEKTVPDVSVDKKVFLKGTGSIAGVAAGPLKKMSFTEAKKQKIMSPECADMLLDAQAATGHIIDPRTNQKLTVKDACARGVVDKEDESRLYAVEAASIGYRDPNTAKLLSAGQAMRRGLIDKDTALRILQAQQSVGGILDPVLGLFLPKDLAMDRHLIDEDLYQALNQNPECYLDPDTRQGTTYISLKKKCKQDPSTGLLLLPEPEKPLTVQGLREQVLVTDLVDANLLDRSDVDKLRKGRLTSHDIEKRLCPYLRGSTCIAGVYDEASDKTMSLYQAMKDGLLQSGTTLELLEAQAASGFIVDPVNNHYLTVSDAYKKSLFGPEFKDKLLSAERAVTGYKLPGTDKTISLFQAIERGLVEKSYGIRLLGAQIASGGIIDPEHSHRIDASVACKRGYFDEKMEKILSDQSPDAKSFFDPNTEENLSYPELKKRCITDKRTGLTLLSMDKKKLESISKNTLRKRRVVIVDPETNKEMTVREAYDKGYIDYDTFVELSMQECEWEEITITAPDGSTRFLIIDKKTGREYDITELTEMGIIDQADLERYRARKITLTDFADIITKRTKHGSSSLSSSASRQSTASGASSLLSSSSSTSTRPSAASGTSSVTSSSSTSRTMTTSGTSSVKSSSSFTSKTSATSGASSGQSSSTSMTAGASDPSSVTSSSYSTSSSVRSRPLSPTLAKMTTTRTTTVTERSSTTSSVSSDSCDGLRSISSVSINLASPVETVGEQEPVGAIFDTETLEKITITEALNRGLVDAITAQRLLEAQACTGGIINPTNGQRLGIQEAARLGIIDDDMVAKLKPAQKAYVGFEDVKTRRKMSVAEAVKETWLPYEAGQRFMEFQYVTGGLHDPEMGCRRGIQDGLRMGWLDGRAAQRLQDVNHHTKNLTCPKSKLKISYKEALDNCLMEESTGVKMLQASTMSSRGISSPYNVSSAPGSATGSRSGSRRGSRRSSVDLGSPTSSLTSRYSHSTFTFSSTK